MPCISANSVLVFIPPPVEPGDAPTNIKKIIASSPAFENSPSEYVEKPAVLAVTLLNRAPIHGISSVILKITAPPTVSATLIVSTTLVCIENFRQRNRFSTISRITRKPIPPKNIKKQVTRFKNTSSL